MKKSNKLLSSFIINFSIKNYSIYILIILFTLMYFFYNEVLNSSITYGALALKNQANIIQEKNTKFVYTLQGMEKAIEFSTNSSKLSLKKLEELLKYNQDKNENIYGTYLLIKSVKLNKNTYTNKSNSLPNNYKDDYLAIYRNSKGKIYTLPNYTNYNFFTTPLDTNKLNIYNPEIRNIGEESQSVYSISMPIIIDGKTEGVIGMDINMNYIYNILKSIQIYNGKASIALLDNNGTYLTHSTHKELIGKTLKEDCPEPEIRLKALKEGKYENFFADGGMIGALTNPLYFSKDQTPWQLQAKVHASVVFESLINAITYIIPIILICFIIYIYTTRRRINQKLKPLTTLTGLSYEIAKGDLTQNIAIDSNDEIGRLANSFSEMIKKLNNFIVGVQKESENCKVAATQVEVSSQTLNTLANEQAAHGEEISSNSEEMSATVQQNANHSIQIKKTSNLMLNEIEILLSNSEKAKNINENIVQQSSVINNIAFNIKILALNAAVEAARAGENGKGFGVVAREIQKLSEHTTISAAKITEKINLSTDITTKIYELISTTAPQVAKLNSDIEEVNASTQEQSLNIQQVSESIQNFNSSTQSTAASSEELASTSEELKKQADNLYDLTKQYKVIL